MRDTNHTSEANHERTDRGTAASTRAEDSGKPADIGGSPRRVSSDLAPTPASRRAARPVREGRRGSPTVSVQIGEGLTDDEIVDAFAHLLLALSREGSTIAQAPGESPSQAIGGEEPTHGD